MRAIRSTALDGADDGVDVDPRSGLIALKLCQLCTQMSVFVQQFLMQGHELVVRVLYRSQISAKQTLQGFLFTPEGHEQCSHGHGMTI